MPLASEAKAPTAGLPAAPTRDPTRARPQTAWQSTRQWQVYASPCCARMDVPPLPVAAVVLPPPPPPPAGAAAAAPTSTLYVAASAAVRSESAEEAHTSYSQAEAVAAALGIEAEPVRIDGQVTHT